MTVVSGDLDSVVVDLHEEAGDWSTADQDAVVVGVHAALAAEKDNLAPLGTVQVGVVFADDAVLRSLNGEFRGKDAPTNVLSFPSGLMDGTLGPVPEDQHPPLGEILISCETAVREADLEKKSLHHHLSHLAVHGTLHLIGYDHEVDQDAEEMESRERSILQTIGVPDPYAAADSA